MEIKVEKIARLHDGFRRVCLCESSIPEIRFPMNSRGFLHLLSKASAAWLLLCVPAFSQTADLETLVEKSRVAMKESRWEQALDFNTLAVSRYEQKEPLRTFGPQFGAVYFHKGTCEMKLKKWLEAMQSFETCYRDFPNDGATSDRANPFQKIALLKWGEAAMGAGNWELAVSRFTKFISERDKTRDRFSQGAFYINIAVCQYKLARIPEGNENLEIAINNKENFPTPDSGIAAGFQALVSEAIGKGNEQALLDFIEKNRGGLVNGTDGSDRDSQIFLKLAGDALAVGMQRAALAIYQLIPCTAVTTAGVESPEIIKLSAVALIHEKNGNVRGAFAAYQVLVLYFPPAANSEDFLYHLVRTASIVGDMDIAQSCANELCIKFPKSIHRDEIQAFHTKDTATPLAQAIEPVVMPAKEYPQSREFTDALVLYQGRKYQEAKTSFAEVKTRRKSSVFAGFYELECLRKLGDLDGLARARATFVKDPSLGGNRLRQLEIDEIWEDVRRKNWAHLDQLANERALEHLPGDQRAQVAYCQGLAFENLKHPLEALNAYNIAMTADAGASEEIARQASLNILRIHQADPEVQTAIANWGTAAENRESAGFSRLKEAAAVAALFELTLGAGTPLPSEFKVFLNYKGGA